MLESEVLGALKPGWEIKAFCTLSSSISTAIGKRGSFWFSESMSYIVY